MTKSLDKKNFLWNSLGSTINAFTSFFFLLIATRLNTINLAGIFTFGYSMATILNYVGLYYGRVYQVSNNSSISDFDFTITRIITSFLMVLICLIFVLVRNYDLLKSLIIMLLCVFKALEAYFDNFYAIFQKNNLLYKVGISQTLKGVLGVIIFFVIDFYTKNLILSIVGLITINLILFILYDLKNIKPLKLNKKFNSKNIIHLLKVGAPIFLIYFFTIYLSNSAKYIIDFKLTDDYQTIFGIIIMPATIVILFVQYFIQPFVVKIKNAFIDYNFDNIKKMIKTLIIITIIFGIVVLIAGHLLGIPILTIMYNVNLVKYKTSFMLILLGALLYGISTIISNVLIILNKSNTQTVIFFIISVISTIIAYFLVIDYQILGASITYTITMLMLTALLTIYMIFSIRKEEKNDRKNK